MRIAGWDPYHWFRLQIDRTQLASTLVEGAGLTLSILNSRTDITARREVSFWVCRGTELPSKLNQICISGRSSFGQWHATAGLDLELVADSGGVIQWLHQERRRAHGPSN